MRNKNLFIVAVIISFSLSTTIISTLGTTYTCGVKAGDEYIYEITHLDPIYGGSSAEIGDKMKIKVVNVTEKADYFIIDSDSWNFISSNESFGATADQHGTHIFHKNPNDQESIGFFVLCPVNTYLAEFAADPPPSAWNRTSSGNTLTYVTSTSILVDTYNSNGVLSKHNLSSTLRGVTLIVFEMRSQSSYISGYNLPMMIGLSAIAGLIVIYIKKKNFQRK